MNEAIDRLDIDDMRKGLCKIVLFCLQEGIDGTQYTSYYNSTLQFLYKKEILTRNMETGKLEPNSNYLITNEEGLNKKNIRKFVEKNLDEYRNLFSKEGKGNKALKAGTLGDPNATIERMCKWFIKTKFKYTWKEVLNTTRVYISQQADQNYIYLQRAHYA